MYKFHYDYGYNAQSDCLFDQSSTGTYLSLNTSSAWYQNGLNFSFLGGVKRAQGKGYSDPISNLLPMSGNRGGQHATLTKDDDTNPVNNPNNYCVIHSEGSNIGFAGGSNLDSDPCPDTSSTLPCSCVGAGNVRSQGGIMNGPRTQLIHPRISINSGHFSPTYKQCGEAGSDGEPAFVRFYHEVGANPDDPTAGYYDAEVGARRLMRTDGAGQGCSLYDVAACDVPDGYKDPDHPNPYIRRACSTDYSIIVYKEPLPNFIRPAKLVTSDFLVKYLDETRNPTTAQRNRLAITIDQHARPMIMSVSPSILDVDVEQIQSTPSGCVSGPMDYYPADPYSVMSLGNTIPAEDFKYITNRTANPTLQPITQNYPPVQMISFSDTGNLPQTYMGWWTIEDFYDTENQKWPQVIQQSNRYIPNEKSLLDFNHDQRDAKFGTAAWGGDSGSSTYLVGKRDPETGLKDLLFLGLTNSGNGGPQYWAKNEMRAAIDAICDEYGMDRPDYADENYDFADLTTPLTERPTLGYKVYKSWTSAEGPFTDITNDIAPYAENILDPETSVGYPCVDPQVPCYTVNEQFIDSNVEENETYWYYTTTLESIGTNNYIESDPSDVVEITVPASVGHELSHWSDENKLYMSRDVIQLGLTQPANVDADYPCLTEPVVTLTSLIARGYKLGDNTNSIPFLGFTDPFTPPIVTDGSADDFCLYLTTNDTELDLPSSPPHPNRMLRPLPNDATSWQYVMGYPYDCASGPSCPSAHSLYWSYDLIFDSANFASYIQSIQELNFTRHYRKLDKTRYEPYYLSEVGCVKRARANSVKTFKMNPARYGNGRSDYGEDWSLHLGKSEPNIPSSYLGFYSGEYLFNDIFDSFGVNENNEGDNAFVGQPIETFIVKDAKVDSQAQNLEYFRLGQNRFGSNPLESLKHLDMSNNGLHMFDLHDVSWGEGCCRASSIGGTVPPTPGPAGIEYINLSDNDLCSGSKTGVAQWIDDSEFPSLPQRNDGSYYMSDGFLQFPDSCQYVNLSNNVDFQTYANTLTGNGLEYLDLSNTSFGKERVNDFSNRVISSSLKDFHLTDGEMGRGGLAGHGLWLDLRAVKTLNLENTLCNGFAAAITSDFTDFICRPWANLKEMNVRNNVELECLNLGYATDVNIVEWEQGGRYTDRISSQDGPEGWGNLASTLTTLDAEGCSNLAELHLPSPKETSVAYKKPGSESCLITAWAPLSEDVLQYVDSEFEKEYLSKLNLRFCALGVDGSLEAFLSQEAFQNPASYPEGHVLEIDIRENTDAEVGDGEYITTSAAFVSALIQKWAALGKLLAINIDVE